MSEKLSDSRMNEIRERLKAHIKDNPMVSNTTVGKNIGYTAGYVSQFINNKFPAKTKESEFALRVENYLNNFESQLDEAVSSGHLQFAMTAAAQDIFKTADYAAREHKIGVITGVAGCGKTISVQEFKKRNPNHVLIEISPIVTQRSLLQDIAVSIKIPIYYSSREKPTPISNAVLFREIISHLKGTNRLLMCDEGENLTTGCLEIIRRIHDFTRIGVLLSGTGKLLDRLQGPRRELQQLFSRVGISQEVELLRIADARAILQINFPEAVPFANNFLQLSKNNGRMLEHLIDLVKNDIKETGDELTDDIIDDAASMLLT